MFRVEVTSSDGHRCGVPILVDDHPAEPRPYQINQIADSLLIRRDEIHAVMESGTSEELRKHLGSYTKEELKPPRFRKENATRRPFWVASRYLG